VLSRLSLEIVKFYFSRWTSFPGNSAEIWHKVLIPLCRWFIENPRGSLAPFSIGFDSPLHGGLLETQVDFLTPLALAWIPLFGRFIGPPSGPSGPFSLAL